MSHPEPVPAVTSDHSITLPGIVPDDESSIIRNSPDGFGTPMQRAMRNGGGAEGNRTPDLLIANEALSQLSYSPEPDRGFKGRGPEPSSGC